MSRYLKELIAQGEHQHLDFKFEISDAKKIARTFSAFANTKGGSLLIGVKDNGVITGVKSDEEAYMAELAGHMYCKPEVSYSIKPWKVNDKTVLEINIPESKSKPHKAPWKNELWKAFCRVHDENFIADTVQYEVWKLQKSKRGVFVKYNKQEELIFAALKDIEKATLKELMKYTGLKHFAAKKTLASLVAFDLIGIELSDEPAKFYIIKD